MDPNLRRAWTETIEVADYEHHMDEVGQAEANAIIVRDLIENAGLETGVELYFLGAGTGQMFEYVSPWFLRPFRVTFTDINPTFLQALKERLDLMQFGQFELRVDDLEETKLTPVLEAAVLVLVLEYLDWRRALVKLIDLGPRMLFIVIQKNPDPSTALVLPSQPLPGTLKVLESIAPAAVPQDELIAFLGDKGFALSDGREIEVAYGKVMSGMAFTKVGLG